MNRNDFEELLREIVARAAILRDRYPVARNAPVNFVAIFSRNKEEYSKLDTQANAIGKIVETTPTGRVYQIDDIETIAGKLKLAKNK